MRKMNLIGSRSKLDGAFSELDASGALSVLVSNTDKHGPVNVRWSICCSDYGGSWQRRTTI